MTLSEVSSDLFLFLVTFRRQVRKGLTPDPRQVHAQLNEIFDEMSRRVRDDAKLEKLFQKARYPLIVTADEILINSNWAYSQQWEDEIIEYEVFKTRIAGEKFFMMVDDLQDDEEELAEIFYLCLCIGFVGRYKEDAEELRRMKRRLYRMVPGRISDEERRVTPDAYFVGEGIQDLRKPLVNLGRIAIVCGVLLIGLWAGYIYYKRALSQSIRDYAAEMRKQIAPGNTAIPSAPVSGTIVGTPAAVGIPGMAPAATATPAPTPAPSLSIPGIGAPVAAPATPPVTPPATAPAAAPTMPSAPAATPPPPPVATPKPPPAGMPGTIPGVGGPAPATGRSSLPPGLPSRN